MSVGAGATVGVMGAGMGMEAIRELLLKGIEGVDKAQSVASMEPCAPSELSQCRKVAVQISNQAMEDLMGATPFGGGAAGVLDDALSGYLMQMGYEVASKDVAGSPDVVQEMVRAAAGSATTMQAGAATEDQDDHSRMAELREKGVNLLIGGSVSSSLKTKMKTRLFLGSDEMEMQTLISCASIRVTSVSDEKLILIATVTYKKGKTPQQVAQDLASIICKARAAGSGD
jgi:hypothetical protein